MAESSLFLVLFLYLIFTFPNSRSQLISTIQKDKNKLFTTVHNSYVNINKQNEDEFILIVSGS